MPLVGDLEITFVLLKVHFRSLDLEIFMHNNTSLQMPGRHK